MPGSPVTALTRWWLAALAILVVTLVGAFHEGLAGHATIDSSWMVPYADALYEPPGPRPPVYQNDASGAVVFQPWDEFGMRCFRACELPLWQPGNGFGQPLMGNGQAGTFNPFKLILLGGAAGHPAAQAWFLALRHLFGLVGCLVLARRLGLSPWAGTLVALAFGFNGYFLGNLDLGVTPCMVVLPWLLWAAEGLIASPRARSAAILGLLIGFTGLQGHAEGALFAALGTAAVVSANGLLSPRRGAIAGWMAVAVLLGAGVAAIAVLPFLELVRNSHSYLLDRAKSSLAIMHHGIFSVPVIGSLIRRHLFAVDVGPSPTMFNSYVGIVPVILLAWGFTCGRAVRVALPLIAVTCVVLVLCPPGNVTDVPPGLPNSMYVLPLLAMALSILGGAGLDRLLAQAPGKAWLLAAAIAFALAAYGIFLNGRLTPETSGASGLAYWPFVAVSCALGLTFVAGRWRAFPAPWLASALVLVTAVDLVVATRAMVPPLRPFDFPTTPILSKMRATPGPFRTAGSPHAFLPNLNLVYGVDSYAIIDPFLLARHRWFNRALQPAQQDVTTAIILDAGFQPDLLDLANIRFIVTAHRPHGGRPDYLDAALAANPLRYRRVGQDARASLYENLTVVPRAQVVYQADFIAEDMAEATRLLGQAPGRWRDRALLEVPRPATWQDAPRPATPVVETRRSPHELHLKAKTEAPGWLVLADAYYPGWVATVDDQPTPIIAADVAFRAVYLPAGDHRVTFSYRPRSVAIGGLASLLALLLAGLLLLRTRRDFRGPGRSPFHLG